MDANEISPDTHKKIYRGITTALVCAVLEWLLLSMLFVDAIFAFIITKYARFYKLQTPCLLCSRLDHVLGSEKQRYYWDLICGNHKLEISSLVTTCHAHNKLVDVRESPLSSLATTTKSNAEKSTLLEGKLQEDNDKNSSSSSSSMDGSCCCSEPLILGAKSIVFEATERDVPSSDATPFIDNGFGSELKVASDPKSEVLFLDNDEETDVVCETKNPKDLEVQHVQLIVTLAEDSSTEKLIDRVPVTDPSVVVDSCGALPAVSTVSNANDLEELNRQPVQGKNEPSTIPELISFDVAPPSSNGARSPLEVSSESVNVTTTAIEQTSVLGPEKVCEPETVAITRTSTSFGPQSSNLLDLGDAYKVALASKEKQQTDVLAEPWTERNSSKVNADFRRLLSQLSAARGFDQSMYDISPRLSINDDVSNSIGLHMFQKRISLERNESGLSLDGSIVSIVSEVDGESLVDRLRRQIEHDRKSMSVLYKELEEERNASAIAANQAMAMITKLQEEKAALNMEASQYLRMMEEQSEYDTETLQKLTDLLAEKEKEIQDLEEELEFYKRRYPNESTMENSEVAKSLLEFEDESSYILHTLKKLEKKLLVFSNNGVHSDLENNQYAEEQSLPSVVELKSVNKENDDLIGTIRNEVYDLNDRLRTLEADRSFLEHAINSLRNGNEGLQFIQEIASHLRELRKIGMNRRDQSLT